MRIVLESIGGFTGPAGKERREVDTDKLRPDRAKHVQDLVARVAPGSWGNDFHMSAPRPWDFRHVLTVDDGNRPARSVQFHEGAAPPEVLALFRAVNDDAT